MPLHQKQVPALNLEPVLILNQAHQVVVLDQALRSVLDLNLDLDPLVLGQLTDPERGRAQVNPAIQRPSRKEGMPLVP